MHTLIKHGINTGAVLLPLLMSDRVQAQVPSASAPAASIAWSAVPIPSAAPGEPNVGAAVSPMRKGQRAPFTGVLLSPVAVATVITMYATLPQTIQIETSRATAECQAKNERVIADNTAECTRRSEVSAAELKRIGTENEKLRRTVDDLEKKQSSAWSSYVWAGLGAVGGIGLTLGVVYLVGQATK